MSDQGDAGQWRPATSQNDHSSTADDTTGPLPAISDDEAETPGFPPTSGQWAAADDDDAPTGGFPAVPPTGGFPAVPPAEQPPAPGERSVFEPVDRADFSNGSAAPEPEDPGPNGATPRFGTEVPAPEPEPKPSFGQSSFGEVSRGDFSFGPNSFGEPSEPSEPAKDESAFGSFGEPARDDSSFKPSTFGEPAEEEPASGAGSTGESTGEFRPFGGFSSGSDEPEESSFRSFRESSSGPGGRDDDRPSRPPIPYRTEFSAEAQPEARETAGAGSFTPPAPENGVSAEAQAEENDFFASDDHPPMWDKVVAPAGPPPKPGKPSSGNLRLPDWMRDENGSTAGGPPSAGPGAYEEDEGRSRRPLFIGLGILVAGLVAVAGVYFLKGNGDNQASNTAAPTQTTQAPSPSSAPPSPAGNAPVRKNLPQFKGAHTKAAGRINDARSGLSYARFAAPWAPAQKNSPMAELGFTASQFAVTEKAGSQPKHWARLMSAQLSGAASNTYNGPGTERAAATQIAKLYEARMFGFQHKKRILASQPLDVGGHKGWLVGDYLTYRRPGVKATGDVVAVALVDTGRKAPGVLFMSVPNTSKKLWPDVNFVVRTLRVA